MPTEIEFVEVWFFVHSPKHVFAEHVQLIVSKS